MQTPPGPGRPATGQTAVTLPATAHAGSRVARRLRVRARGMARVLIALLLVITLAGCDDLRLETGPPTEPVPDAFEEIRRTAVEGVVHIIAMAESALAGENSDPVIAGLQRVVADGHAHYAALGGTYDSGLAAYLELEGAENPALEMLAADTAEPAPPASWPQVAETLFAAGITNRITADHVADGEVARLLASIGASQTLHAIDLWERGGDYSAELLIPPNPAELVAPAGVTVPDFQAIIKSEDAARFAFEVAAARSEGMTRTMLIHLSRLHGERAAHWAAFSHVAGTDQDPRQVAYQVPEGMSVAELVLFVESGIADIWANLIPVTAADTRVVVIEEFLLALVTAHQWGGAFATFPGMPEIAGAFGGAPPLPDEPRLPPHWAQLFEDENADAVDDGAPPG